MLHYVLQHLSFEVPVCAKALILGEFGHFVTLLDVISDLVPRVAFVDKFGGLDAWRGQPGENICC
jgi:hypothetical protein